MNDPACENDLPTTMNNPAGDKATTSDPQASGGSNGAWNGDVDEGKVISDSGDEGVITVGEEHRDGSKIVSADAARPSLRERNVTRTPTCESNIARPCRSGSNVAKASSSGSNIAGQCSREGNIARTSPSGSNIAR